MSIWKEEIDLAILAKRSDNTLAMHLGICFTEIGENFLVATMPVDHRTRQPLGILNGGASCALAETVGSTAANFCVDQRIQYCVGLDINANHLRPAKEGMVIATASPLHLGKKTQVWAIDILNELKKRICVARLTMAVIAR